ncbi:MAG: hypothetical protein R3B95_06470 [Nitrospirales bacterium]|nr:hypothetical protein [Nitrospirales bacterium]
MAKTVRQGGPGLTHSMVSQPGVRVLGKGLDSEEWIGRDRFLLNFLLETSVSEETMGDSSMAGTTSSSVGLQADGEPSTVGGPFLKVEAGSRAHMGPPVLFKTCRRVFLTDRSVFSQRVHLEVILSHAK